MAVAYATRVTAWEETWSVTVGYSLRRTRLTLIMSAFDAGGRAAEWGRVVGTERNRGLHYVTWATNIIKVKKP